VQIDMSWKSSSKQRVAAGTLSQENDSYDAVIARRAKILAREKKPHGIYHIGADGQRSRVK
jgi:hypothetical protein